MLSSICQCSIKSLISELHCSVSFPGITSCSSSRRVRSNVGQLIGLFVDMRKEMRMKWMIHVSLNYLTVYCTLQNTFEIPVPRGPTKLKKGHGVVVLHILSLLISRFRFVFQFELIMLICKEKWLWSMQWDGSHSFDVSSVNYTYTMYQRVCCCAVMEQMMKYCICSRMWTLCRNNSCNTMPPERIELSTPGLQDQCSATEL